MLVSMDRWHRKTCQDGTSTLTTTIVLSFSKLRKLETRVISVNCPKSEDKQDNLKIEIDWDEMRLIHSISL